jgi:predicted nucleic acid-binding protein
MNMHGENSVYEGIVDVSIIVVSHFENPLKETAIAFLKDILLMHRKAALPLSAFLGSYHILTRYIGANKHLVARSLRETLNSRSPALYEDLKIEDVIDSLDYAEAFNLESWDGYLISLAFKIGSKTIYTLDQELRKVKGLQVIQPFEEDQVKQYHEWLNQRLKRLLETKPNKRNDTR